MNYHGSENIQLLNGGADQVEKILGDVMEVLPSGPMSTAYGDNLYGINHSNQPSNIPINRDMHGYTFFTRPRLNLTTGNIRNIRKMVPLTSTEERSLQRAIRCTLDPELAKNNISSPFVDPFQAFIPILSNNLLSMSGWPDVEARMHSTDEGVYGESMSMVDSTVDIYSTYDITASFRNLAGDPITALFLTWVHYASNVYLGNIVPYPDALINNEIDYTTRIYRLVMDPTMRYVQKIAACGAAFPWGIPIGAAFNFESDRPLNQANDQLSFQFRCTGAMYQDDILVLEFNRHTELFNDTMGERYFRYTKQGNVITTTNPHHRKLTPLEKPLFKNFGYPHINPYTYELEWWVPNSIYNQQIPLMAVTGKTTPAQR